jgi:hypothetical protein
MKFGFSFSYVLHILSTCGHRAATAVSLFATIDSVFAEHIEGETMNTYKYVLHMWAYASTPIHGTEQLNATLRKRLKRLACNLYTHLQISARSANTGQGNSICSPLLGRYPLNQKLSRETPNKHQQPPEPQPAQKGDRRNPKFLVGRVDQYA